MGGAPNCILPFDPKNTIHLLRGSFDKMRILKRIVVWAWVLIAIAVFTTPKVAFAQTDEIQVYVASIAGKGKFNLTVHSNFTPSGLKTSHPTVSKAN